MQANSIEMDDQDERIASISGMDKVTDVNDETFPKKH